MLTGILNVGCQCRCGVESFREVWLEVMAQLNDVRCACRAEPRGLTKHCRFQLPINASVASPNSRRHTVKVLDPTFTTLLVQPATCYLLLCYIILIQVLPSLSCRISRMVWILMHPLQTTRSHLVEIQKRAREARPICLLKLRTHYHGQPFH